jgi:hypothetical protein
MTRAEGQLVKCMGLRITGDCGPYTFYKSKRGDTVWYPRSPPEGPSSPDQIRWQSLWKNASAAWHALGVAGKRKWIEAARKAYCRDNGYCLFMSQYLRPDLGWKRTLERQTGITLP